MATLPSLGNRYPDLVARLDTYMYGHGIGMVPSINPKGGEPPVYLAKDSEPPGLRPLVSFPRVKKLVPSFEPFEIPQAGPKIASIVGRIQGAIESIAEHRAADDFLIIQPVDVPSLESFTEHDGTAEGSHFWHAYLSYLRGAFYELGGNMSYPAVEHYLETAARAVGQIDAWDAQLTAVVLMDTAALYEKAHDVREETKKMNEAAKSWYAVLGKLTDNPQDWDYALARGAAMAWQASAYNLVGAFITREKEALGRWFITGWGASLRLSDSHMRLARLQLMQSEREKQQWPKWPKLPDSADWKIFAAHLTEAWSLIRNNPIDTDAKKHALKELVEDTVG